MTRFKLGKLPAQPATPRVRFVRLAEELPAPPPKADWYSEVTDWPMYLNDQLGDCVWAGFGHHIEQDTHYGQGTTVEVSDSDIETGYESTGYVPGDPSTDQGTVVADGLSYWRKAGVGGHKITAFAAVDPSQPTEVKQAVSTFGAVGIGFNFPAFAMDQFDAGKPWDVQKSNASIEGGHYVIVVGYDGTYFYVVTWGKLQKMTPAFFKKYVDEAWVIITPEMVSALSRFGTGLHALGEEFADLTGQANPFPGTDPTPTPTPGPDGPTAADVVSAVQAALAPFQ